ncbi:MAG: hypothetical protein GXY60_06375 [Spirochaetales bacterium]|nr:hypothetical protein [Spirochaetales bacterium]
MTRKALLTYLIPVCIIIIVAVAAAIPYLNRPVTLEFSVIDSVVGAWVWDFEAKIQDKTINGYFQSDRGPKTYRFTNLKPGTWTLTIHAPSYRSVELQMELKKGINTIETPIVMEAYQIDGLAQFLAFEQQVQGGWDISLRAATAENSAILYHPPLDLRVFVQVYPWNRTQPSDYQKLDDAQTLYWGQLPWTWDTTLESQFRYNAHLEYGLLAKQTVSACVIRYLVLVRNPDSVDVGLFATTADKLASMQNLDQALAYLKQAVPEVPYYTDISWDVPK